MLAKDRQAKIISKVNDEGSVTLGQLADALNTSESTIRRDLSVLHDEGLLLKVRGGAVAVNVTYDTDDDVPSRRSLNIEQKRRIGRYAGSLIRDNDVVFIDAGTTTEKLIPYIAGRDALFVTNAVSHALKLTELGLNVRIVGGEFKNNTEAIVGEEAVSFLQKYNFTIGFFGTNGVSTDKGYTTPELRESLLKEYAMRKCQNAYVLADSTKLGQVSSITFARFEDATVLTDLAVAPFGSYENVVVVPDTP